MNGGIDDTWGEASCFLATLNQPPVADASQSKSVVAR